VKALLQRVTEAGVSVDGDTVAEIGAGLLVLVCIEDGDNEDAADFLARKTAILRIFDDEAGKMNRSVADIGGAALVVSQFTLAADTRRGNRPSYARAAAPQGRDGTLRSLLRTAGRAGSPCRARRVRCPHDGSAGQ